MSAFRTEMREARDQGARLQKFVPSSKIEGARREELERRANDIFGLGVDADAAMASYEAAADDFDEWPDEFLLLGVAAEDGGDAATTSDTPESTTSDTLSTEGTEETEDTDDDDDDDDAWPIELLVG